MCLYDETSRRGLLPFLSRTNLCFFQSTKNLPSRRQELKASRRISGYASITSLRISFGTPSIPGSTCGNKLRTMYLTRSGLSRPGVFPLVTNLLVTILKARPHGSFSTSTIKSFQQSSHLFFMPCLRADFAIFHTSCSRESHLFITDLSSSLSEDHLILA